MEFNIDLDVFIEISTFKRLTVEEKFEIVFVKINNSYILYLQRYN